MRFGTLPGLADLALLDLLVPDEGVVDNLLPVKGVLERELELCMLGNPKTFQRYNPACLLFSL